MNVRFKPKFCLTVLLCVFNSVLGIPPLQQYESSSGTLTHTFVDDAGKLFVGGRNVIMRFSQDLVLEEMVSTAIKSSNCSEKNCSKDKEENGTEENDVSIFIFYPYNNEMHILFCGTADYGSCALYNRTSLSANTKLVEYNLDQSIDHYLGSKTSALAIAVPVNTGRSTEMQIFSAMDYDGRPKDKFPKVFSVRKIWEYEEDKILHYAIYYSQNYISLNDKIWNEPLFDFKYCFQYNGYTYFLRNTKHQNRRGQISEVCSNDHDYRSYVESDIECDGYSLVESAFLLEHDNLAFLYIAFSSIKHRGTVICEYSMDRLRSAFRKIQKDCFNGNSGSAPDWTDSRNKSCQANQPRETNFYCGRLAINTRIKSDSAVELDLVEVVADRMMSSLVASTEDEEIMFYIGFQDGTVSKYLKTGSGLQVLFSVNATKEGKINDKMVLNQKNERLYFTYANKIEMIRTDNCTLHSECIGCLSDVTSCQWCVESIKSSNGGKCIAADDSSCTVARQDFCDPEIDSVTPLSGPTAGGTLLTLQGQFGNPTNSNFKVTVGSECSLNYTSNERINCVTQTATSSEDAEIRVDVDFQGADLQTRPVRVKGSTTFLEKYSYRVPSIVSIDPLRSSSHGRPILKLTGTHLDIGTSKTVDVSGKTGDILSVNVSDITFAMAEEERATGVEAVNYKIDSAITSVDVTIIPPPIIETVVPKKVIQAGGLTLTVIGLRLDGLGKFITTDLIGIESGQSYVDTTSKVNSRCRLQNETTMLCRAPPVQAVELPHETQFRMKNKFGPVYYNVSAKLLLTVVEDPTIENLTETLIVNGNNEILYINGTNFKNVEQAEIKVTVGRIRFLVSHVTDDVITCVAEIPSNVHLDSNILQVQIGNIIRPVGLVHYTPPLRQSAQGYADETGTDTGVVILCVIGGIVALTCIVVLGMKRLGLGPFKRLTEDLVVAYRSGGSDVLTLDGLSENHATDISQNRQNAYQEQTFRKPTVDDNYDTCSEPVLPVVDENTKLALERQQLIIDRDSIVLGEIIGQGHFGCVYKGYLQTPGEKGEQVVAAKTVHKFLQEQRRHSKEGTWARLRSFGYSSLISDPDNIWRRKPEERKNPKDLDINMFLKEALIMKDFQHRHVMRLVGICLGNDQLPLVILPFMQRGDLLSYLRDPKNVPTVKDLVTFGVDIANGMCYLAELKFVHRDLAARNCMMDDEYRVKVADFGLSRDVYEKGYYSSSDKTTKLPVKWMAPESLEFGMYNAKSDVWSYGVVLWELLTRGVNPYPEVDNWDILKYLKTGRRMSQPSFCPEEMFSIMQRCWSWEPAERPSFGQLTVEIPALLRQLEHSAGEKGGKINIETTYVNFMARPSNN